MRRLVWLVFLGSIFIHLLGLNRIGRTWDEPFKVDTGYVAWDNLLHGRLGVSDWSYGLEHPPLAKYVYGATLPLHLLNITPPIKVDSSTYERVMAGLWISTQFRDRLYMVKYDLTAPRLVSVIANSLTVTLTYLLALRIATPVIALIAPIVLLFSPRFLVMGQLITFESLSALATVSIAYFALVRRPYLALFIAALSFWVRYSNLYSFLLLGILLLLTKQRLWPLVLAPVITFVLGMILWPLLWHQFPHYLLQTFIAHQARGISPSLYIPIQFLITTPEPILLIAVFGFWRSTPYLKWWLLTSLIFFSLASVPTGGTRYAIAVYPALALLAVQGVSQLNFHRLILPIFTGISMLYLVFTLWMYSPYYLDYYNLLVGGVSGAISRGFTISWWGEGQREAALWLKTHARAGDTIALYVTPRYVFPTTIRDWVKLYPHNTGAGQATYLVLSRDQISPELILGYHLVYSVKVARAADLVQIYRINSQ